MNTIWPTDKLWSMRSEVLISLAGTINSMRRIDSSKLTNFLNGTETFLSVYGLIRQELSEGL